MIRHVALGLLAVGVLAAQQTAPPIVGPNQLPPPPPDETDFKIASNVDVVLLDVSVKDPAGGYVSGLNQNNFIIREDGKPQKITFFTAKDVPVTVGLVVDNSRSMAPKRPEVVTAALAFVQNSHPQDEVFVVNFNDFVHLGLPADTPFSDDIPTLRKALLSNPADGKTALYDGIMKGLEQLNEGRRDKKTLVVVSDGGDNASEHSLDDVVEAARRSVATIYTIGIFDIGDKDKNPGVLKKLASLTGGEAFFPEKLSDIVDVCRKIATDIRNRYTVAYVPENRSFDNHVRHVVVTASAPDRGKLHVRTRSSYIARSYAEQSSNQAPNKKR